VCATWLIQMTTFLIIAQRKSELDGQRLEAFLGCLPVDIGELSRLPRFTRLIYGWSNRPWHLDIRPLSFAAPCIL
jgi:hypothetical protein